MKSVSEESFQKALDKITELSSQNAALLEALLSLTQWVGRGIADGAYSDCVAPDVAVRALDRAEELIRKAQNNGS